MKDLFEYNLSLLRLANPALAARLSSDLNGEMFFVTPCQTKEENNLYVRQGESGYFLHDPEGPSEEAKKWADQFSSLGSDVIYVYGLGLGYLYEALIPWLTSHPDGYLVFLEDNLAVLRFFLGTAKASLLLQNSQTDIRDFSQAHDNRSVVRLMTLDYMLRSYTISALPSYQTHKKAECSLIHDLIEFETNEQNIRHQELAQFGLRFFNNFYRNLFQLPHSYTASALFNRFKNVPAIICGAGPSLVRQLPLLKTLRQRAILFAPGSALNILSYHGVWPHFGVNIDPTAETFHRQIMNRAFDIPIFYRNRLYYEALTAIHGPRLFLSGAIFYLVANWFEEQLGIKTVTLEGGYNVVHTTIEIAQLMGCNPLIFVGMDLSFREEAHYATGVERHPLFPQKTDQKPHLGQPIQVNNIKGEPVLSYWPWLAEAHWTDLFSRSHPDITMINATEEGIGLFSIPNLSLQETADTYLKETFDLDQLIHDSIQEGGLIPAERSQIEACIQSFYQSLKQCERLCEHILDDCSSEETIREGEAQLKGEAAFNYLLQQFDDFFLTFIQRDLRNLQRLPPEDSLKRHVQLNCERYRFLLQTARVNSKIIENTLAEASAALPLSPLAQEQAPVPLASEHVKKYYYPSGKLYSQQIVEEERREGPCYVYYEDGTLKAELPYQGGHLNGKVKLYYPNGQLKRELSFESDQREGLEKSWYENGQLFTEVEYHHNRAKRARCWFPDGSLAKDVII